MKRFLKEGETYYFMHIKVAVIKVFEGFHLAEVASATDNGNFVVDICTLTDEPETAGLIPLRLFGRNTI